MWGTFPFGSSVLAILVFLIPERKRRETEVEDSVGDEAEDSFVEDEVDTQKVAS
jgi:hypothetical protein